MEPTTEHPPHAGWQQKPIPDGFAETFIRFGWRGVEAFYGSRTSCNKRWIAELGPGLLLARARYRAALRRMGTVDARAA